MIAEQLIRADMISAGRVAEDADERSFIDAYKKLAEERFMFGAPISEEELRAHYDANREEFGIPASVRISQIQIRVPDAATPEQRAEARARAEEALKRLNSGEDFAAVAKDATENPQRKGTDGDIGFVWRYGNEWLESALEGLSVGEYTQVLESPVGYDIIRLTDERDAVITPYEQVTEDVREHFSKERMRTARDAYVGALAAKADIEVVVEDIKAEYPQGLFSK
jgi:parvulin-like peptidyl-prolyl isomerase